ncbi:FAD:protein FMN transferase [Sulfidibacter corallicola]|uniref:FAD:protein FMN transferase n=1 Tax=Sulfidibacter corallicola TaxID=2818388 RepID=A0A8A4TUL5_SULCO|nr:FAD:protein FMN transferase [Sulfidibacter corallicola]QTD53173.1 FAD:protein FMN transferase [Sulfidibacter corallicola]
MGTTYSVKVVSDSPVDVLALQAEIQAVVDRINGLMSNWVETSDLSRFNRHQDTTSLEIDPETAGVIRLALNLAQETSGSFDPTVSPLIELWGFGTKKREGFPEASEVERIRELYGWEKLVLEGNQLRKTQPTLNLNLGAIAKGYAVDAVADHLAGLGFQRYMVEIGGEVRTSGSSARGVPWRIGIEDPRSDGSRKIYKVANLSGKAMATSGDYRIFFTHEGQVFSHILDPRSGYPIPRRTASVSVIADDCATADALATAFMIPEPAACIELVENRPDLECMILEYGENDELKISKSSGFDRYLSSPAP